MQKKTGQIILTVMFVVALISTCRATYANKNEQAEIKINITVQEIAELAVINDVGSMVVDDTSYTFMGNPSSDGDKYCIEDGQLAVIEMRNNFHVDAIQISYENAQFDSKWLGVARGAETGHSLGVRPGGGYLIEDDTLSALYKNNHYSSDAFFYIKGPTMSGSGFSPGMHRFGLGVKTLWSWTFQGEPEYARPDTYSITLTATIIPQL